MARQQINKLIKWFQRVRNTMKGRSGEGGLSGEPMFSLRTDCQKTASQGGSGESASGRGNSKCVDPEVGAGMQKRWVWLGSS